MCLHSLCNQTYAFIGSPIFTHEFHGQHPQEWTNRVLSSLEKAMKAYKVEVIANTHFEKEQQISCGF
jgi:hypothetical protein